MEELTATKNTLTSSLRGINSSFKQLRTLSQDSAVNLATDLQAINDQLEAINDTLNNAEDYLGGDISDISDEDTATDLTSKILDCYNKGKISADLNVGGIVGAIALENDLDPEEDVEIIGNESLNFESELRSVILSCTNEGSVDVKRQNIGGIVGWMSMGLVKDCESSGPLVSEDADYVGGIAGQSKGYIRSCSVKATLTGDSYVGGIAGSANIVSDCYSMVSISGEEKVGTLLGYAETTDLADNYYLPVGQDIGGVDGVSYAKKAQPLSMGDFLASEDLPEFFRTAVITFTCSGQDTKVIHIPLGEALDSADIPPVPEKDGYTGSWDGLEETDLTFITFDKTFPAVYTSRDTFIQSELLASDSQPLFLAQGDFLAGQTLKVTELSEIPPLSEREAAVVAWSFAFPQDGSATQLRFHLPAGQDAEKVRMMIRNTSGEWTRVDFTEDGSYLVFPITSDLDAICLIQMQPNYLLYLAIAGAGLAILLFVGTVIYFRKRKN